MSVLLGSVIAYGLVACGAPMFAGWFHGDLEAQEATESSLSNKQGQDLKRKKRRGCLRRMSRRCINVLRELFRLIVIYVRVVKVSHVSPSTFNHHTDM